jgi:hypothetical protein
VRPVAAFVIACALAGAAYADSPPVGPLPKPKVTTLKTTRGSLFSIALPRRGDGYVWRIARALDSRVVREVAEGDVGTTVVLVFRAAGRGHASIVVAETKGETAKAYRAVRYDVTVS